jgi:hypothetical protein
MISKVSNFLKKKRIIIFLVLFLGSTLFFRENLFAIFLFGNSDTQLSVNSIQDLYRSLFSWNEVSTELQNIFFPFLFPSILKVIFELLGFPMTSVFSALLLFCALVYFFYKITVEIIDLNPPFYYWLIFIISLFSIANEMMRTWLISNLTITWGMLFFLISFYCFLKFKNKPQNKFYLFLLFITLLFAPIDFYSLIMPVILIFSFLAVEIFVKSISSRKEINSWLYLKNIIAISAVFFALNSYWLFNNIYSVFAGNSAYTKFSTNTIRTDSVLSYITTYNHRPSLDFILSTTKDHSDKFYPALFYFFDIGSSFAFVLLAVLSILFIRREQSEKRKTQLIVLWVLYIIFFTLSLGPNNPAGIFEIFWNYVPGFKIFRDYFKFNRIILPILIVLVSYSAINILVFLKKKRHRTVFFGLIVLIILIKFIPYYFLFPKYKPFKVPDYYYQVNEYISKKKIDSKVQIMPVISWMQTFEWSNQDYNMQEPLKYFVSKSIFFNDVTYDENYDDKLNKQLQKYLIANDNSFLKYSNIRGAGFLIARNDLGSAFLEKQQEDFNFIGQKEILESADKSSFLSGKYEIGKLSVYELNKNNFLPHFYTPQRNLVSERGAEELPRIFSSPDWQIRSAVFFENQNTNKAEALKNIKPRSFDGATTPVVEYKKINPTKYRIRVHSANGIFPLVFSESYHEGWKAYLASPENLKFQISNFKSNSNDKISNYNILDGNQEDPKVAKGDGASQASILDSYKIIDGNEEDQATKTELVDFIKNGWVTTLGDGKTKTIEHMKWENMKQKLDYKEKYSIDFISKNFQGTIQNDNLPSGSIFETWFKNPIEDKNHLMANGYANSWVVDVDSICNATSSAGKQTPPQASPSKGEEAGRCVKNADGSYDFEMVVEFWPQRLFYIGLAISGTTLLLCIGYLIYDWRRRKRKNVELAEKGK